MPLCLLRSRSLATFAALALAGVAPPAAAESITGVCPDGSVFVVQRPESIPCRGAKRVQPHEVPPLRPEYLPRPYAWEVFQSRRDPNNPYNLIDAARAQEEAPPGPAPVSAPPPRSATAPAPDRVASDPPAASLQLGAAETRDLLELVELSQRATPAAFTLRAETGEPLAALRLAHSEAFEARARRALRAEAGHGPVVLFALTAAGPMEFHPNLTFVQGHVAFHPTGDDPAQIGFLAGRPGALAAGQSVLGYAVLPAGFDPDRAMDVYWDDRRLTARLRAR